MRSEIEVQAHPGLRKIIGPSLESDRKVNYMIDEGESLTITVETDSFGPMRGATDTVFRLAMLGNKILER